MRGAEWVRVRVVRWRRGVPGAQVALRLVLDVLLAQLVDSEVARLPEDADEIGIVASSNYTTPGASPAHENVLHLLLKGNL